MKLLQCHTVTKGTMKSLILMLFLTVGGSMGMFSNILGFVEHCGVDKCEELVPGEMLMALTGLPNGEQLKELCPPFLEVMKCYTDLVAHCTGQTLEELGELGNRTVSKEANFFLSLVKINHDLCNEDTELHKNYVENFDCIGDIYLSPNPACVEESQRLYKIFRPNPLTDEYGIFISDEARSESLCMRTAYELACVTSKIQKSCGDTAKDFFSEVMKRTKFLKVRFCNEEDFVTLKSNYIDFLEGQGKDREFLVSTFDFRRK